MKSILTLSLSVVLAACSKIADKAKDDIDVYHLPVISGLFSNDTSLDNPDYKLEVVLGNYELSQEAVDEGANVNKDTSTFKKKTRYPWLLYATSGEYGTGTNASIINFLLNNGADVKEKYDYGRTVLHYVAVYNNVFVPKVLELGADINALDDNGCSVYRYLSESHFGTEKEYIAKLLYDKGAKATLADWEFRKKSNSFDECGALHGPSNDYRDKKYMQWYMIPSLMARSFADQGITLDEPEIVRYALVGDSASVCKYIAKHGIPESKNVNSTVVAYTAAFGTSDVFDAYKTGGFDIGNFFAKEYINIHLTEVAAFYGNTSTLEYMLKEKTVQYTNDAVLKAAVDGVQSELFFHLIDKGIKPSQNCTDILVSTANICDTDILEYLLKNLSFSEQSLKDAVRNVSNRTFVTQYDFRPLGIPFYPYDGNYIRAAELLIKHGAKVDWFLHPGIGIFDIGMDGNPEERTFSIEDFKLRSDLDIRYVKLLVENGADFNTVGGLFAVRQCSREVMEYLLKQGYDVNYEFADTFQPAQSVLTWAFPNNINFIDFLLDNGADVNCYYSFENGRKTPLIAAATCPSKKVLMRVLEQPGLDINFIDDNGKTALDYAYESNKRSLRKSYIQLMKEQGALTAAQIKK